MCPFNQHWLVDCNSTMKLRLLYLHRSSKLSLWPCHAPSRGFTLQPHNQPTRLCDIILGPVLGMLKSDACHAHSHSSSISKAFDGKRGKKKKKCLDGLDPCRDMRGGEVAMNLWGAAWWASNINNICAFNAPMLRGMGSVCWVPRVVLMQHILSLLYFLSTSA